MHSASSLYLQAPISPFLFLVQTHSFLSAFDLDFISFVCETGFFLLPTDWTSLRAMDVPQNRDQIQVPALSSTVQSEPGMEDSEATATGNTSLCPGALPAACPTLLCHWYIDVIWSDVSMHTPKKESPETWASLKSKQTLLAMCKPWFFSIIIYLSFHQVGKRHVPGPKISSFSEVWSIFMKRSPELSVWANLQAFPHVSLLKKCEKGKKGHNSMTKKSQPMCSSTQ